MAVTGKRIFTLFVRISKWWSYSFFHFTTQCFSFSYGLLPCGDKKMFIFFLFFWVVCFLSADFHISFFPHCLLSQTTLLALSISFLIGFMFSAFSLVHFPYFLTCSSTFFLSLFLNSYSGCISLHQIRKSPHFSKAGCACFIYMVFKKVFLSYFFSLNKICFIEPVILHIISLTWH